MLRTETDLPPILGIATAMTMISAAMVEAGSSVSWPGGSSRSEMAIWICALAQSSSGKTWIARVVGSALGIAPAVLPEPASGPAYLAALEAMGGRAYWLRDEYGQLMRSMASGGPRADMRDLILRTYDHAELVHSTRTRGELRVARPVVTIYGTSVDSTWRDCIDATMLADGLMARQLFLVAPGRPLSVPRYPEEKIISEISRTANGIADRIKVGVDYEISPTAAAVYDELWRALVGDLADTLDPAYIRRITWSAARYAAIYHVILGCTGTTIGVHAMRWAWRMVMVHCHSARLVLTQADQSLAGRIDRIGSWVENQRAAGVDVTTNTFVRKCVQQHKRDLRTVGEARELIRLVAGSGDFSKSQ